jgi:hypothetical protein
VVAGSNPVAPTILSVVTERGFWPLCPKPRFLCSSQPFFLARLPSPGPNATAAAASDLTRDQFLTSPTGQQVADDTLNVD